MRQRLGQHFLKASWAAAALADAAKIKKTDTILEIGPGRGALTDELLKRAGRVIAIEKDAALVGTMREKYRDSIANGTLDVIEGDIRDASPQKLGLAAGSYMLAANIPYYITGDILRQFLSTQEQPRTIVLLVQKEVAQRIARDTKESILSLSVKAYGTPRYVKTVTAGNFSPPPSVDSAILSIEHISRDAFQAIREDAFFRIVKMGFSSKRKVLRSNLARIAQKETIARAFEKCGIPLDTRAEDVPLERWLYLTKELSMA
ncbi:ribosomal RNA small subunit methyltransferase A [Candidatus Kaiserbacteria bacterium]|nr:ribosomal RNA small subunit methyltransferase A [Candidatus Kaiserbacteria bacterium]